MSDRDLPEGVIDADPPGGWEGIDDGEAAQQNADAEGSEDLVDADEVTSDEPSRGTDPDLGLGDGS